MRNFVHVKKGDVSLSTPWGCAGGIELNGIWVRALPFPMHLGLKTGPLCSMFCTRGAPVPLAQFQMAPILGFLISSGSKKEGTQMCMSEWSQALTLTQNVVWGFLFSTAFPISAVITQPHYIWRFSQGVMSSKEANNSPGLCPVKGNNRALVVRSGSEINHRACK